MRKFFGVSALAALAIGVSSLTVQAQEKGTELTAGLLAYTNTSCDGCDAISMVTTGGPYVSAGFYLNHGLAIEPVLSVLYESAGGESFTQFTIGVGVPIYFAKDWGHKGWYVTPRATWTDVTCTGCSSASQTGLGVALGVKVPLSTMASLRIQAMYDYGFETNTIQSTSTFGIGFGLSAFIKKK